MRMGWTEVLVSVRTHVFPVYSCLEPAARSQGNWNKSKNEKVTSHWFSEFKAILEEDFPRQAVRRQVVDYFDYGLLLNNKNLHVYNSYNDNVFGTYGNTLAAEDIASFPNFIPSTQN